MIADVCRYTQLGGVNDSSHDKTSICVIQTFTGEEEKVSEYMDLLIDSTLVSDKFIPMRKVPHKVHKKWVSRTEKLFPGYLFVETTNPRKLFIDLKRVPGLSKLLGDSDYNFFTLEKEEIGYINRIGGNRRDHIFGISRAEIDDSDKTLKPGDRVKIISGDLLDFQGEITRYDLHHRKAFLKTELFGGMEISVGIELVVKAQ